MKTMQNRPGFSRLEITLLALAALLHFALMVLLIVRLLATDPATTRHCLYGAVISATVEALLLALFYLVRHQSWHLYRAARGANWRPGR